jgi:peptide methionine sulfoxide reductase MsrA
MVAAIAALAANANTEAAMAVEESGEEGLIDVYFGCGCFWHVQHEFVEAEKKILGRKDDQLTARAGYAGGTAGAVDGKVCYHNAASVADYGKLGHAEVVGMKIPSSKFKDFAVEYFKLFDAKGDRPDQAGDRGGEYRSLVGVPGGAKGPYAKILVDASIATGDKLDFAFGKGDDKDARKTSFVMDSEKFPFYVAEQYHQFHVGFNLNENYPSSYNNLSSTLMIGSSDGLIHQFTRHFTRSSSISIIFPTFSCLHVLSSDEAVEPEVASQLMTTKSPTDSALAIDSICAERGGWRRIGATSIQSKAAGAIVVGCGNALDFTILRCFWWPVTV